MIKETEEEHWRGRNDLLQCQGGESPEGVRPGIGRVKAAG